MSTSTTRNLLHGTWTAQDLETILTRQPRRPLLPPLGNADWQRVAANPLFAKLFEPLREMAREEWQQPLPELTDELYASFRQTGVRLTFELVYFERRRRLGRAALSLLLSSPDDPWHERLVTSTLSKLESIFDEVSWALPAHVNWDNQDLSGKEPLQIDLFCAETANLIAEMLDVFGEIIPGPLRDRIRARLQKSVFENYLARDFHWMTVTHNWNAVCHQGVVGAALSQVDDPHQLAAILLRVHQTLPNFLNGYGPDGGCSEGPGYWNYGFGWFTILNEQLETRTKGELSLFEGDDKIRAIARYGPRMALASSHLVNFADGPPSAGLNPSTASYLGQRLHEPDCDSAAISAFQQIERKSIEKNAERTDVFYLLRLALRFPTSLPETTPTPAADCYLPNLAVLVARGKDAAGHLWEFAAKGGHNGEHHNHNDCGSYLLNVDGIRLITEIGAPEYVHDFFGPKRYEFLAARSLGHSVPLIKGVEQKAGSEFASKVLSVDLQKERVTFELDLTACYPAEACCRSLIRRMTWDKIAGRLQIEDSFELEAPGEFESPVVCEAPCETEAHSVFIKGGALTLRVSPLPGTQYAGSEQHSFRGRLGEDRAIHRLRFLPKTPTAHGKVAYEIQLA
ncbi:hypothetical protein BH09VER1_BH09VER1_46590 [soil metagenome]